MATITEIQEQIGKLYKRALEPAIEVPLSAQAWDWFFFAKEYAAAAKIVAEHRPRLWLARLQLTGLAVELALKACIAASRIQPPAEHDLVRLYTLASEHGYSLPEPELAAIVHLDHFYNRDAATGTRFKARYPTRSNEPLGGSVPSSETYEKLIDSLCADAGRKLGKSGEF